MKFCPVVPENCRGQVHGARKERIIIIIIIIRNGAKQHVKSPNDLVIKFQNFAFFKLAKVLLRKLEICCKF
jgi:hypothetical protein